jgi:hypothetical protein
MTKSTTSRRPVQRSLAVLQPIQADGTGTIRITCDRVIETYQVQTFAAYDGAATGVSLTKTDGTRYDVAIPHMGPVGYAALPAGTCDCKGHTRWSHCKHLDALLVLANRGQLPVPIPECDAVEASEAAGY